MFGVAKQGRKSVHGREIRAKGQWNQVKAKAIHISLSNSNSGERSDHQNHQGDWQIQCPFPFPKPVFSQVDPPKRPGFSAQGNRA